MNPHVNDESADEIPSFSEANPLVEIISIEDVYKHPNADALDLVSPDGSNVNFAIVKSGTFKKGDIALWLDSVNEPMVPVSNPLFAFLAKNAKSDGYAKIKAMKLRGIMSRGLIIPFDSAYIGKTNKEISDALQIKKHELNMHVGKAGGKFKPGLAVSGPVGLLPCEKYDVDSLSKNWKNIPNGTQVWVTEKIHGANSSYGWLSHHGDLKFWVRSRTLFKKEPEEGSSGGLWWDVAEKFNLKEKLKSKPGYLLYGEVYGQVQDLKYGVEEGAEFRAFDCWNSNSKTWLTFAELVNFCNELDIPMVPILSETTWNTEKGIPSEIISLSEGSTHIPGANHVREGIVIRGDYPIEISPGLQLNEKISYKLVGTGYLTR